MTARKLPTPPAVAISFDEFELLMLEDALFKYAASEVPKLLEGEIRHLEEIRERFSQAKEVLSYEWSAAEIRHRLSNRGK